MIYPTFKVRHSIHLHADAMTIMDDYSPNNTQRNMPTPWSELTQAMSRDPELAAWVLGTPHDGLHFTHLNQTLTNTPNSDTFCEALWEQLGFSQQEWESGHYHAKKLLSPTVQASIRQTPEADTSMACTVYHHRNGTEMGFQRRQRPVRQANGQITGIIAKLTRCDPQLTNISNTEALPSELMSLKTAMELSQQKLLNFTSVASHDLQAPLRHINGMVQLLLIHNEDVLDEKGKQLIHRTIQSVETLQHLIDDLLTYSQVESRSIQLEPLAMHRVCGEAIEMLSASIEESGATIECDFLPTLHADRSMMMHLMQNLISNGLKYCGDSTPSVVINSKEHLDHWTISVEDNGIGIDPMQQDHIFDSFKRLHSASSYSGTGLGLSICKTIVERHGGSISVDSVPGQGSRFYFNIPKQRENR